MCFFEFLQQDGAYRVFLADLIRNRDLTEEVLSFNGTWALAQMGEERDLETSDPRVMRAVIVQMGGFYELMYHCLMAGDMMDVAFELSLVVRAFVVALGYDEQEAATAISPEVANEERIADAVSKVNAVLL